MLLLLATELAMTMKTKNVIDNFEYPLKIALLSFRFIDRFHMPSRQHIGEPKQ